MDNYLEIVRQARERYRAQVTVSEPQRLFPHCPRCASYYLYRRNNAGAYECQTCGQRDIAEDIARSRQ